MAAGLPRKNCVTQSRAFCVQRAGKKKFAEKKFASAAMGAGRTSNVGTGTIRYLIENKDVYKRVIHMRLLKKKKV